MSDVLIMSALEFRPPIVFLVHVIADNLSFHLKSTCQPIEAILLQQYRLPRSIFYDREHTLYWCDVAIRVSTRGRS
jgi:hypothetical protein